ncbi:NAD(P)H-dependent oxidoreductase subunit E [Clostridium intestinale]|uniref:NADH-quinone oxidoreductase subunit NuoE family protein n=1 Tax=Clostridium intestinale TaxID=36845 RepID=UPI0028F110EA|nr:NAD(P)H-dependent oxidoreductase subunit E [Clostridium intestinale]
MNMDLEKDLYLKIEEIIEKYENNKNNILGILLEVQAIAPQQYISADIAKFVSRSLGTSLSRTYDVITFYSALSDKPRGQYVIQICNSTACMVNKYETLKDVLEQQLEIKIGETTNDGVFTLIYSPCFGACDVSPAFRIGDEIFGELSKKRLKILFMIIEEKT